MIADENEQRNATTSSRAASDTVANNSGASERAAMSRDALAQHVPASDAVTAGASTQRQIMGTAALPSPPCSEDSEGAFILAYWLRYDIGT